MSSYSQSGTCGFSNREGALCSENSGLATAILSAVDGDVELPEGCQRTLGKGVNDVGPILGSWDTGVLPSKKNESTSLDAEALDHFRHYYRIPSHVILVIPSPGEKADCAIPGFECWYVKSLEIGALFPLPRLVLELCNYYQIHPSQLMPNVWRVLLGVQVFCDQHEIKDFTLVEVLYVYSLVDHGTEKGRYQFKNRLGTHLITGLPEGDRNWKDRYLFVSQELLGTRDYDGIPYHWSYACDLEAPDFEPEVEERVENFISFSEKDRSCKFLLSERSLYHSSAWEGYPARPLRQEGIIVPATRLEREVAIVQYNCEILGISPPPDFVQLTPANRAFAKDWMDNTWRVAPRGGGAMTFHRSTKKKADAAPSQQESQVEVFGAPPPPVQTRGRKKRLTREPTSDLSKDFDDLCDLSSSSLTTAALAEFAPAVDHAGKVLYPRDEDTCDELGAEATSSACILALYQALSMSNWMKKQIGKLTEQVRSLRKEKVACEAELKVLLAGKEEVQRVNTELKLQVEEYEHEMSPNRVSLAQLERVTPEASMLRSRLEYVGAEMEVQVRGEMAIAIRDGKTGDFDLERFIEEFEEYKREIAPANILDSVPPEEVPPRSSMYGDQLQISSAAAGVCAEQDEEDEV